MSVNVKSRPTVLLTNDDGPPDAKESPYIFGLYKHLTDSLGWDVKVVVPSSQKSWIGKAYQIKEITKGSYFYPTNPSTSLDNVSMYIDNRVGGEGETSPVSRPLKENEMAEWILLDATPATCANIGIHNIYPNEIDLVISGPNLGRNSSSAFALSSGTVGAAMSSSLSKTRSIAISYGTVVHPTPTTYFEPAHILGMKIIEHLWQTWGSDEYGLKNSEVDLYNVNIPLIEPILSEEGLKIYWTTMWRTSYGRLFKAIPGDSPENSKVNPAGPDTSTSPVEPTKSSTATESNLVFKWSPAMEGLIRPQHSSLVEGSDGWALHHGAVSVTPLRASFAEPVEGIHKFSSIEDRMWKVRL
ncbi:survival protein sure-like phosphatase/nucleotidase [Lentinula aciculospora]|uniref:Survival protein sure-like phosphatase/nucleotidase n=1 Tax=Lentinula aciculospora TaxID=153920 RepID=A0A9W9AP19_9AGAR|nr:survival protein sure-like phosphatase/nucleotidase [Lentinula aciculospora]